MNEETYSSLLKVASKDIWKDRSADKPIPLAVRWGGSYKPFGGTREDYQSLGNNKFKFRNFILDAANDEISQPLISRINKYLSSRGSTQATSIAKPRPLTYAEDTQRILNGDYTLREINSPKTSHTIARGDNYSKLAERYGVPVRMIAKANPGVDFNNLQIGSTVNIPEYHRPAFKLPPKQLETLIAIESSGNPNAAGDLRGAKHYSRGLTQIREVYPKSKEMRKYLESRKGKPKSNSFVLDDVNDRFGTTYTLSDRTSPDKAKQITQLWLLHQAEKYYKQHNRFPSEAEMARMWNAGEDWKSDPEKLAASGEYLKRYMKQLNKQTK